MFSLHETTRKRTCRTAFFALCLAPTCATAAWIADHYLPWRAAAAARRLSDRYHLEVALTNTEEPRPRMTRSAAVTLAAPNAADPLVKLTGVETHRRGDALILTIDQLSLNVANLSALASRLEWSLARTDAARIELHVNALTLQPLGDATPITLHQLKGLVERDQAGHPRLRSLAHLNEQPITADQQQPRPPAILLTVETSAAANNDQTATPSASRQTIKLDTQQNTIPVALLVPLIPGVTGLNDDATFAGVVTWQANATGDAIGRLAGVDLAQVLPQNSPHALSGAATIELTACHWEGEQFQRLAGTLIATDAQANGSFLIAASGYLGCPIGDEFPDLKAAAARVINRQPPAAGDDTLVAANRPLSYFACGFDLDAAGLAIEPCLPAASTLPADTLAASENSSILFCPPLQSPNKLAAVAWLQFIASPAGPYWIPVTPETLETARRLPPPAAPTPGK